MGSIRINSIIPMILIAMAVLTILIVINVGKGSTPASVRAGTELTSQPVAEVLPDGDTASDTLRDISVRQQDVQKKQFDFDDELSRQKQETAAAKEQAAAAKADAHQMALDFQQKLTQAVSDVNAESDKRSSQIEEQLKGLEDLMTAGKFALDGDPFQKNKDPENEPSGIQDNSGDLPIGGLPAGLTSAPGEGEEYIWLEPLGGSAFLSNESDGILPVSLDGRVTLPSSTGVAAAGAGVTQAVQTTANNVASQAPEARFTIPNLATLAVSTGFTALVGKVPIDGQLRDPIPFRVLVGRENLAASGLDVPDEVISMVFEGDAIGEWTLGCVEGRLHTATFVFADGTINTVSTRQNGSGGSLADVSNNTQGGNTQIQDSLGYITDRFGIPCISGERVSNAAQWLAGRVGLGVAGAAAEAAAASQTTQIIGAANGTVANVVSGRNAQFIAGRGVTGGLLAIDEYLAQRLANAVDIVFVPPGQELAILIQKEIPIDYQPLGRRLSYGQFENGSVRRTLD